MTDELAARRARIARLQRQREREDADRGAEIDLVTTMTETEAKCLLRDVLSDVSRLTAAVNATHPGAMGPGDATIDVAIALLETAAGKPSAS